MAITQTMTTSFKVELFTDVHDFSTDTIKMALFTSAATLDASTTTYNTTNEVTGTGYDAGGKELTKVTPTSDGTTAIIDFSNDVTWATSTITARGALIYNDTVGDRAIAVLDFGSDKTSSNSTFTVTFPAATATSAIIRIE